MPKIQSAEDAFHQLHGIYWQGISTMVQPPADGADQVPDTSGKPGYETQTWNDLFSDLFQATEPCATEIHQYQGPQGDGYTIFWTATIGGTQYQQAQSFGPEAAGRTHDWSPQPTMQAAAVPSPTATVGP